MSPYEFQKTVFLINLGLVLLILAWDEYKRRK